MNKLNETLIDEFSSFLDYLESNDDLAGAVLLSGKENNFIAGADIEMFKTRETAEELADLSRTGHEILLRVENFSKPIVVGIHGSCMGGGTELALACHYRIVSDHSDTTIGLPEVKLGLLPGWAARSGYPVSSAFRKPSPTCLPVKTCTRDRPGKQALLMKLFTVMRLKMPV